MPNGTPSAPRDPKTRSEWQAAVDAAHACLAIDSARQYGLITGGPKISVGRCVQILERGKAKGYEPRPTAIEDFVKSYRAEIERLKGISHD